MTERLPLFPLGTVLFPGLLLPLHVFEERYRSLVRDLTTLPEPEQRFGVVAIRAGREVGADGVHALHDVGCAAQVRRVEPYDDGRFDLVASGGARFRLLDVDAGAEPYLVGQVEFLDDGDSLDSGAGGAVGDADTAALLVPAVTTAFRSYLDALGATRGVEVAAPDLPDEPLLLSYLVAATVLLDTAERQQLLAAPDAVARLRLARSLLHRENALLGRLTAVAAPDLTRVPLSPN